MRCVVNSLASCIVLAVVDEAKQLFQSEQVAIGSERAFAGNLFVLLVRFVLFYRLLLAVCNSDFFLCSLMLVT